MTDAMSGYRRVNYYELCRLCTSSVGTKMHIFREEGRRRSLPNKIQTCLPLTVQEEDSLPKIICSVCVEKLEGFFEFRESCINAEAMLESYFTSLRYSEDLSREGKVSVYVKEDSNKKKEGGKNKPQQIMQSLPVSGCNVASSSGATLTQNVANQTSHTGDNLNVPSTIQILTDQDGNRLAQYKVQVQGGVPSLVPAFSPVQVPIMKEMQVSHDGTQTTQTEHVVPTPLVAAVAVTGQHDQHQEVFTFNTKDTRFGRAPLTHIPDVMKMKNISIVDASGMEPGLAQIRLDPEQLSQLMAGSGLQLSLSQISKVKHEEPKEQEICTKLDENEAQGVEVEEEVSDGGGGDPLAGDNGDESSNLECEVCDRTFKRKEHLLQHKKSHTGQRPFGCAFCGKAFSRKEHLIRHKVSHTGQKQFPCDICQKNFSRKDNLHKHRKTHGINGPHVCEICGKSFVVKHYYAIHKATHEKEKNGQSNVRHGCEICLKAFSSRPSLEAHRLRHRVKEKQTHTEQQTQSTQQEEQQQQHEQQQQQQQEQQQQQQQQIQQQPTILTSFPINTGLATINSHALIAPNIVHSSGNMVQIGNTSYVCTTELLDQYRRLHS